jgi:predicted RNase H-like HicB family nuclease
MRYAVIIEKSKSGYSAYVPDLPGCIAAARTLPQVKRLIHGAIEFHMEGLRAEGQRIPKPTSLCDYAQVKAA